MTTPTVTRQDESAPTPLADLPLDPHLLFRESESLTRELAATLGYDVDIIVRAQNPVPDDDEADEATEDEDEAPDADEDEDEIEDEVDEDAAATSARAVPPALTRAASAVTIPSPIQELAYIPITRVDHEKWEVEGTLSDEQIDTFGTIFDFASMQRAVESRWHGNVREQHDPRKAVGRGVWATFDPETKTTRIRTRISRGAPDTWAKVEDGVLAGFSVGAANAKTETRTVNGRTVPCFVDFDLAEVSLVDAPSNPGAKASGLVLYRAAGIGTALEDEYSGDLAADDTPPAAAPVVPPPATDAPLTPEELDDLVRAEAADLERALVAGVEQYADLSNAPAQGLPALDHGALEAAMDGEKSGYHLHQHAYTPGMVHHNDHDHTHADGQTHPHPHMHAHAGHGDGSAPHAHLHDHGHEYRATAPDHVLTSFISQDDPQLRTLLPAPVTPRPGKEATPVQPVARAQDPTPTLTRVAKRISADTATGLHEAIDKLLATCCGDNECPRCKMMLAVIDPDGDGDDDLDPTLDTDQDLLSMSRVQQARLTRRVEAVVHTEVTRALAPQLSQFRAIAARLAGVQAPDLARMQSDLTEAVSRLAATQGLVERIAEQEAAGQPLQRAGVAQDKRFAIDPQHSPDAQFSPDQIAWLRTNNLIQQPSAEAQTALSERLIRQQIAQSR